MAASTNRFATLDSDEFENILKEKDAVNTRRATKSALDVFRAYLAEKELPLNFEQLDKNRLSEILAKFYVELRKADGEFYKRSSLVSIRAV